MNQFTYIGIQGFLFICVYKTLLPAGPRSRKIKSALRREDTVIGEPDKVAKVSIFKPGKDPNTDFGKVPILKPRGSICRVASCSLARYFNMHVIFYSRLCKMTLF
jgi:hypothetical protein